MGTGNLGPITSGTGYNQPTVYRQGVMNPPGQYATMNQPTNYPANKGKKPGFMEKMKYKLRSHKY